MYKIAKFMKSFFKILAHGQTKDRIIAWCIVILLVIFTSTIISNVTDSDTPKQISTSTFVTQLQNDNVAELHISNSDGSVKGTLKDPNADGADGVKNFTSHVPERSETFTQKYLDTSDIDYDYEKPPAWVSFLSSFVSLIIEFILIVFLMTWMLMKVQGGTDGMMPFGSDDDNSFRTTIPDSSFDDIVGIPEALEEVSELVTFLQDPDVYRKAGAECPRGILLEGSPGVGKTALARALAGEAGVNFISASGSDFIKLYVGQGAKKVRELFSKARKMSPSIIFIDEIDAIGGARSSSANGTDSEQLRTINALLAEMDGFDKKDNIIVIGATNRVDTLDDALIRPGRFDRVISIDVPAKDGRIAILKHYAIGHPFAEPIDFDRLAKHTSGFSGAELKNVMNEAATLAARRTIENGSIANPKITKEDLDEAISRTISGPALKSKRMNDKEKREVAYHEVGHAVAQYLLPECDPIQKISIVSRRIPKVGTAMGYVQSYSEDDAYVMTSKKIYNEIVSLMAGRCSESHYCNIESAGASDDLKKASKLAYDMVDKYSFQEYGAGGSHRVAVRRNGEIACSQKRLEEIDDKVNHILDTAYNEANGIVQGHEPAIKKIVSVLLDKETIDSDEIRVILEAELEDELEDGTEA